MLGGGQLAERHWTATRTWAWTWTSKHQHGKRGKLRRRLPGGSVLLTGVAQKVNRRRVQAIGHLHTGWFFRTGHRPQGTTRMVSLANIYLDKEKTDSIIR